MSFTGVCNSGGDIFVVGDERWLVITLQYLRFLESVAVFVGVHGLHCGNWCGN